MKEKNSDEFISKIFNKTNKNKLKDIELIDNENNYKIFKCEDKDDDNKSC